MTYRQEPPFAVQVEFSEGCNLYCDFCGLQGIREKKVKNFRFMKSNTARRISSQMSKYGWNSRVEFAMHGEPTMNPRFIDMVKIFRRGLPDNQLMMTSNGGGIIRAPVKILNELFDAGLNVFAFDNYQTVNIGKKIIADLDEAMDRDFKVFYYPDVDPDASPHKRWSKDERVFICVQDISQADKGTHSVLNNHCGAGAPPLEEPLQARCAKPFRELSIRWDGNVAICCNDWRGVYKIGNIYEMTLEEIWLSERMDAARRFLYHGERGGLSPCDVCDAKSYRVGLLPDKKGQDDLDPPNSKTRKIALSAYSGPSYTDAVLRPWEEN